LALLGEGKGGGVGEECCVAVVEGGEGGKGTRRSSEKKRGEGAKVCFHGDKVGEGRGKGVLPAYLAMGAGRREKKGRGEEKEEREEVKSRISSGGGGEDAGPSRSRIGVGTFLVQ